MLKRFILRWLYPRLVIREKDTINYLKTIVRYKHMLRTLSLDNASSRTIKQYKTNTRSANADEFLDYISNLNSLIDTLSDSVDQHRFNFETRQERRFNLWLMDNDGYVIKATDLQHRLDAVVSELIVYLKRTQLNKEYMFHYYLRACVPTFKELIEIMDLLVCIDLGVNDVKRNARSVIAAR